MSAREEPPDAGDAGDAGELLAALEELAEGDDGFEDPDLNDCLDFEVEP